MPLDQLTTLYTNRIKQFIQNSTSEPFFLFYSHNYPHTPYESGANFAGTSAYTVNSVRGDVMEEIDWSIGEVVSALTTKGILDNTIIIFTSDNGPTVNHYAKPYSGTKFVTQEGGHRVPLIFFLERSNPDTTSN